MTESKPDTEVQGEGDYVAGRRFQDAETAFVKDGPVEQKAREAAEALDSPEADELEAARTSTAGGVHHKENPEGGKAREASAAAPSEG